MALAVCGFYGTFPDKPDCFEAGLSATITAEDGLLGAIYFG